MIFPYYDIGISFMARYWHAIFY